jgi:hypothetical protein
LCGKVAGSSRCRTIDGVRAQVTIVDRFRVRGLGWFARTTQANAMTAASWPLDH